MAIQQMFLGAGGDDIAKMSGGNNNGKGYEYTFGGITYRVHTFLSSGTLTVLDTVNYEALLVGGGGGGKWYAGGGGGGGVIHVGAGTGGAKSISSGNYTVEVGDGGSPSAMDAAVTIANDGESSTFNGYTATGGGAGGGYVNHSARQGANGGGSGVYFSTSTTVQGVTPALPGGDTHAVAHGGYTGGARSTSPDAAGGGAGSGQNGSTASTNNPPHGGNGTQIAWATIYALTGTGNNTNGLYWGGGGGGPLKSASAGNGGTGGGGGGNTKEGTPGSGGGSALNDGGDGVKEDTDANDLAGSGGANTGGGGGGSWGTREEAYGGSGGSGIVIIRYAI